MKQITKIILCVLVCLLITACSQSIDNTCNDPNKSEPSSSNNPNVPPNIISFSSIDELDEFLSISNSSTLLYNQYLDSKKLNLSQKNAQNIASYIKDQSFPIIKTNITVDGFGATYYMDRNELDIKYRTNGTRYRFIYCFTWTLEEHSYSGTPIIENIVVGQSCVDLYQGDGCLVGSFLCGDAMVRVVVEADDMTTISFDSFEFNAITTNTSIR